MRTVYKTSMDRHIENVAKSTGQKPNGIEWAVLQNAAESIVDEVEGINSMALSDFHAILDKYTLGTFKNPENFAIRGEAVEQLKILGYTFTPTQVFRRQ